MTTKTLLGAVSICAIATTAIAQDADLLVFDYPGFEEPSFHETYVSANGASPTFSFFGDEEEAFQKIRAGFEADVTHICAGSVTKWTESGIIEPWDVSRISEYANIDRNLTGQSVGGDGDVFFVPTDFGATAVAYNPDEVPAEDVASLNVFKNPAYAGRMTLPDNVDDAYALAYLATGVTDWAAATDEQFEAASNWLREVHPNLRTYWTDPAELAQLMSTGEILVSWAWNETLPTMMEEGRSIAYQREATEGSSLWLCGYVNMTDGQGSEDKAYDYINAILDSSATVPLLDSGFGHANAAAMATIPAEDLDAVGLGVIDAPVLAQLPMSNERREQQAETFEMIKAGF
ncbi:extracellular solute-binding protein [Flavimaricola marinus]|uniref:Spermidine/putrescine-binding periplasmic protein n=1 Tax=Flavimaricola marinus TaxID=1819565 RepID=A0A238LJ01_9RHOB|nr:extracellular solute-binding protein [Flavimaricola marinus]SMY09598.1 Spermidine/putrescine-binding periplasmic protein precursor [Flavimaricola marinus]